MTDYKPYNRVCVRARDANGVQGFRVFMITPLETKPDPPPVVKPDPPEPRDFSLRVNQTESNNRITVTATVASGQDIDVKQWRYLIADSSQASIGTASDCQRLFQNPPAGHVLVKSRGMTKQAKKNTASATISTNRAGHWVCVRAQEQADGIAFGYIALPEPEVVPPKPKPDPPKPTTTTTTPAPTPEPQPQDQPAPGPEQPAEPDPMPPAETPADDASPNNQTGRRDTSSPRPNSPTGATQSTA